MAYPPAVPPTGRNDATALTTNHPADHNQISAALTDIINELGTSPKGDFTNVQAHFGAVCPLGVVLPYAGASAPFGWGFCDGSPVSRATYNELFALIGTTYGTGDGTTTFNLPDLRSRFVAGKGAATWSDALAEPGGAADAVVVSHQHTQQGTFPTTTNGAHDHGMIAFAHEVLQRVTGGATAISTLGGAFNVFWSTWNNGGTDHLHNVTISGLTTATGGAATNANLPPYLTLNHIIRLT